MIGRKDIKHAFIVLSLLLMGCGAGDETPISADTQKSFSLENLQSTQEGEVYATELTGRDSNGATYNGSLSIDNQVPTTLNGILIIPRNFVVSLSNSDVSIETTGSNSIDSNGNVVSKRYQPSGLTCTAVSPDNVPLFVKIGDTGTRSILACDDATTSEGRWEIEDAGNGAIRYISSATVKDKSGIVLSVTDATFTLDSDGVITAFETTATITATNYTITYTSI